MRPRQLLGTASCVACACMCLLQRRRFETALYYTKRIFVDHLAFLISGHLPWKSTGKQSRRILWIAKEGDDEILISGIMCTRCCGVQHGSSRQCPIPMQSCIMIVCGVRTYWLTFQPEGLWAEMLRALPQFLLYRIFSFLACKYAIALAMVCHL